MEKYPWWTDFQKRLADEVEEFAYEAAPRVYEAVWKKEHPADLIKEVGKRDGSGFLCPRSTAAWAKTAALPPAQLSPRG